MDKDQLDRAEGLLGVELPVNYRRFLETLPAEGRSLIWVEPISIVMINDAERLAVDRLELRQVGSIFAGGRWPDRYLAIGGDGSGNT